VRASLASGTTAVVLAASLVGPGVVATGGSAGRLAAATAVAHADRPVDRGDGVHAGAGEAERLLARAVDASRTVTHRGRVTIVSLGERGPQVTELAVERGAGEVRIEQLEGGHLDHAATRGGTRATERLLRVAGLGDAPSQLGLLHAKYVARQRGILELDTGPAAVIELVERATDLPRELLYLDTTTGLVVRRETFDRAGTPVRVVAYVELDTTPVVAPAGTARPSGAADDHEEVATSREVADDHPPEQSAARLREAGFVVHEELGAAYRLLAAHELQLATAPAVHLLYGDGLYTLSLFQQQGRLASVARRDAVALSTQHGGTVWRWPGSEPRHMMWTGEELTFTALSDAPADELLAAIGPLPNDPSATVLDRVARGFQRVGRWLIPGSDHDQ
jgi:hypothetical protein